MRGVKRGGLRIGRVDSYSLCREWLVNLAPAGVPESQHKADSCRRYRSSPVSNRIKIRKGDNV
jgi:hypothetical protein